ncbi:hypothetical protein ACFX2G_028459 [Malus domestica]
MLDTEPAHCTLRAGDSLTANSSDRLASSLLSLGVTRFRATTAAVMSFFIIESPTVRGPAGDMKDGRHMLSGEGGAAPSPRFKSKRRSEGPDIFSEVLKKEEIGQVKIVEVQNGSFYRQKFKSALNVLHTSIKISTRWDLRDRRGELRNRRSHSVIEEAPAFSKVGLAHKPPIPDIEECQLSQPH